MCWRLQVYNNRENHRFVHLKRTHIHASARKGCVTEVQTSKISRETKKTVYAVVVYQTNDSGFPQTSLLGSWFPGITIVYCECVKGKPFTSPNRVIPMGMKGSGEVVCSGVCWKMQAALECHGMSVDIYSEKLNTAHPLTVGSCNIYSGHFNNWSLFWLHQMKDLGVIHLCMQTEICW